MNTLPPDRPIRAGLVGFGMAAQVFHAPLLRAAEGFVLHAAASSRPETVRAAAPDAVVHASPEALFADPEVDLVVIAAPNAAHASLAQAALAAGKHVVVDKPFTLDASSAERLLAQAKACRRMITVFQNRRWDGDFLTLQAVLRSGRIGRPVRLESRFNRFRPQVPDRWRDRDEAGAGIWWDLGPHLVDQALQLFGAPIGVSADLAALRDGARVDDDAQATLHYDRLSVLLEASTLAAWPGPRFVLHGTAGSFVIEGLDPQEAALKAGERPGGPGWGAGAPSGRLFTADGEAVVERPPGDYPAFYAGVRRALIDGAEGPVTAAEALSVMRVLDAGRVAAGEERRIAP